jgi:hypothetical protein
LAQPDAFSGNIKFTRVQMFCYSGANSMLGYLPGFWGPLLIEPIGAYGAAANLMIIDGSGELEGHQLMTIVTGAGLPEGRSGQSPWGAQIAIDITAWP